MLLGRNDERTLCFSRLLKQHPHAGRAVRFSQPKLYINSKRSEARAGSTTRFAKVTSDRAVRLHANAAVEKDGIARVAVRARK